MNTSALPLQAPSRAPTQPATGPAAQPPQGYPTCPATEPQITLTISHRDAPCYSVRVPEYVYAVALEVNAYAARNHVQREELTVSFWCERWQIGSRKAAPGYASQIIMDSRAWREQLGRHLALL